MPDAPDDPRDWFAGIAMLGFLIGGHEADKGFYSPEAAYAAKAYALADAMMAERERGD